MSSVLVNNSSRRLSALLLSKHNQTISSSASGRFNFHTTSYVFAKDSKKPVPEAPLKKEKVTSQAKPQPSATKPQTTQKTQGQALQGKVLPNAPQKTVLQGENMPRTVIRAPESMEDIKNNIIKLCDEEIEFLSETSGVAGTISSEFVKEYLDATKFELRESEEGVVTLVKKENGTTITVTFDKYDEPLEDDEEEQKEEQEEDEEKDEDDINEGQELPYKHNLTIEVAFSDKNGAQKGNWSLYGFAGKDSRLYINDMGIEKGEKKANLSEEEKNKLDTFPFQSLSDDMQDRLYDFLDEVGVDDQLANFVKRYLIESESKVATKFLEDLKDLLKA